MTIPDEAVQAASVAVNIGHRDFEIPKRVIKMALTAALPFLTGVKVEPWGWVIPRGGDKKPIILEASKFDQASAAAEADIHDLGYFPIYTQPAQAPSPRVQALGECQLWQVATDHEASVGWTYLMSDIDQVRDQASLDCGYDATSEFTEAVMKIADARLRALSQPVADGWDDTCFSDNEDDLTDCFRHHIKTSIGWQAFGARTGKERQMYEEGFKAGYRRCKSDNEPELGEAEELSQQARMIVERLRKGIQSDAINLSDVEDAVDFIIDQDARALSSQPVADRPEQSVSRALRSVVVLPASPGASDQSDAEAIAENYLQEIQDGAWGDDGRTRGLARDRLNDVKSSPGASE